MTDILPTLTKLFSNGKSSIDKAELKTKVTTIADDENTTKGQEAVLKKAAENIDRFDANGDGKISLDEIIGFAKTQGNKDGKITKEDFPEDSPESKINTSLELKELAGNGVAKYNTLYTAQVKEAQELQDRYASAVSDPNRNKAEIAALGQQLVAAQTRVKLYSDFLTANKDLLAAVPYLPAADKRDKTVAKYTELLKSSLAELDNLRTQYVLESDRSDSGKLNDLGKQMIGSQIRTKAYLDFLNQALGNK